MTDKFDSYSGGLDDPFTGGQAVTGGTDLTQTSRALWVGTAGNLTIVCKDSTEVTLTGFSGWLPGRITQVKSAGLTASNIVAFW